LGKTLLQEYENTNLVVFHLDYMDDSFSNHSHRHAPQFLRIRFFYR